MLGHVLETITDNFLPYAKVEPDLDILRDDPCYLAIVAAAETRLAAAAATAAITTA